MISLERGFIFTSTILAAIGVFLIEKQYVRAAFWSLAAAILAALGIIHAYDLTPGGVTTRLGLMAAPEFALRLSVYVFPLHGRGLVGEEITAHLPKRSIITPRGAVTKSPGRLSAAAQAGNSVVRGSCEGSPL